MTEDKQPDKDINNGNSKNIGGLVAIGLLFVLAVIAILPSFLNKPQPARQSVGKVFAGSANRAQKFYFEENNRLATNFKEIQELLGVTAETDNYVFKVVPQSNYQSVMHIYQAKRKGLKSYVGLVYITKLGNDNITISKICETSQAFYKPPQMPSLTKKLSKYTDIKCPSGFKSLG